MGSSSNTFQWLMRGACGIFFTTMGSTTSHTVDQLRSDILKASMERLHANPGRLPFGYHSATVEPGLAMLVEPLNGDPYVFVLPNTVHKFEAERGSGTDQLRQRMLAGIFFRNVVDNKRAEEVRQAAGADRVAAVKRGMAP